MTTNKIIEEIEALKQQIDSHGKFPEGVLKKINYKFRLDWNYYSNRMEGGTLTRDETRSVMVGNISVEGKPLKDVLEMNGHDEVVRDILRMGTGKKRLSEKRIKEVHKAIIKEEDDHEKKQEIGKWKSRPNEIINYKNEKILFTQPGDVAEEMHDLLNRVNSDLDAFFKGSKAAKHPLFIAVDFHLDYVSIHPFFDGNGRTARIFTNLILISCGYPPIIIKDDEKEGYYQTLADIQAYKGSPDLFYRLMGKRLKNSLQLMLDAIEGKDIEEPDDIKKRLELLRQMTEEVDDSSIQLKKEDADLDMLVQKNVFPLMELIYKKFQKIESMFTENQFDLIINRQRYKITNIEKLEKILYQGELNLSNELLNTLKAEIYHQYFKKAGVDAFHVGWELNIKFEKTRFELYLNRNSEALFKKLYHQIITEEERKNLAEDYLKNALDQIDNNLERLSR